MNRLCGLLQPVGCHVPLDALRHWERAWARAWEWVAYGLLSTDNCANMANRTHWQANQKVYHRARYECWWAQGFPALEGTLLHCEN